MEQVEQAHAIFRILTAVYGVSPWTEGQIVADVSRDDTHYHFAYDGQTMVGFLALQDLSGELEITNIAVLPTYQGRGYASLLMEKLATQRQPIFLEVRASNMVAQGLYRKYGFDVVGQRKNYYHAPVEDAVLMMRSALDESKQ